jgi:hypothetical protein
MLFETVFRLLAKVLLFAFLSVLDISSIAEAKVSAAEKTS